MSLITIIEDSKKESKLIKDGNSKNVTVLGFEEPGDLTLFALSGMAQNIQK